MRKGSKLLRLAFTRADAGTLYRALADHREKILRRADAPASVNAMEAADVDALIDRILKGIAQLGGLDAMQQDGHAVQLEVRQDTVAAKHAKRVRGKDRSTYSKAGAR